MDLFVVAIRDRAADAFMRPVFVNSLGAAIRSFQDEINRDQPENQLYKHPEDFDLYHLGSFDDDIGVFVNLDRPKQIAIGNNMVQAVPRASATAQLGISE